MIRSQWPSMLAGAVAAGLFTLFCQMLAMQLSGALEARAAGDQLHLTFTTPRHESISTGCSPDGRTPLTDLATVMLWGIWETGDTIALASHAAQAPGAPDGFTIPRLRQLRRVWVESVDLAGNVSCASNPYDLWSSVSVPPALPYPIAFDGRPGLFDVLGRRVTGRPHSGIYYRRSAEDPRVLRIAVIR